MPNRSVKVKQDRFILMTLKAPRAGIDLRFPLISWTLASIPQGNGLFPESALNNDLAQRLQPGKNRLV